MEHQISRTVARCLCKIAFNYMALTCSSSFALSPSFDDMCSFVRDDLGSEEGGLLIKHKSIVAQEILTGERSAVSLR